MAVHVIDCAHYTVDGIVRARQVLRDAANSERDAS